MQVLTSYYPERLHESTYPGRVLNNLGNLTFDSGNLGRIHTNLAGRTEMCTPSER